MRWPHRLTRTGSRAQSDAPLHLRLVVLFFGTLGFQFASADAANAWVNAYYHTYVHDQQRITEYVTNPNISVIYRRPTPTDEEARHARGLDVLPVLARLLPALRRHRAGHGIAILWDEYQKWKAEPGNAESSGGLHQLAHDDPRAAAQVRGDQHRPGHPPEPSGPNTRRPRPREPEALATEVMPEFHDREGEHQEWKRKILGGEIEIQHYDLDAYRMRSNQTPTLKHDDSQLSADCPAAVGRFTQ